MRAEGYGYAIIGGVGAADFFARAVGAVAIPDSTPGIYAGLLKAETAPKPDEGATADPPRPP
jgi:hypothetical protein